ncbi:hypothetical protein [Alkalicoccobacillus plakortidis]|uniref:Uncharacterized protein n=1 Tax=Alkalicoccobacillus plakortidis TaxID=444060 RepID=A0ABT0XPH9_9BACI|nr:hypothetical protein [Alkalicoccobacillus plakortidis]MCM2677799.1 hypothetical protein [Alkalicoccobacillus plakortidis]
MIKYRYRMVNSIFKYQLLRRVAVHLALKIPFIRDKLSGVVFQKEQVPSME